MHKRESEEQQERLEPQGGEVKNSEEKPGNHKKRRGGGGYAEREGKIHEKRQEKLKGRVSWFFFRVFFMNLFIMCFNNSFSIILDFLATERGVSLERAGQGEYEKRPGNLHTVHRGRGRNHKKGLGIGEPQEGKREEQ